MEKRLQQTENEKQTNQKPEVLVGDDQIGVEGSLCHKIFMLEYGNLADYTFASDPKEFIGEAQRGNYDALMIDLRWGKGLEEEGYKVLEAVREYAPIRVLHTSEKEEARERGYQHGATHCIAKNGDPSCLERVLKGGNR